MDLMLEPPVEEVEESVLEPEDLETVSRYKLNKTEKYFSSIVLWPK